MVGKAATDDMGWSSSVESSFEDASENCKICCAASRVGVLLVGVAVCDANVGLVCCCMGVYGGESWGSPVGVPDVVIA